jgi:hypothetical protein
MIDNNFKQEVKFTLKFVAIDSYYKYGKTNYIYYFQFDNGNELKLVKAFSDIAPNEAQGVVISTYDNSLSIKILKKGGDKA